MTDQSTSEQGEAVIGQAGVGNGGPAFPFALERRDGGLEMAEGMTLRDYFAAQTLSIAPVHVANPSSITAIAERAYHMADAMLRARQSGERTVPVTVA